VPTDAPIDHVVFVVKENRTFNNFFATYPGAEGSTEGGTLTCTVHGCKDGPVIQLQKADDVQEHDLTHCFRCGLTAINGGKMNGFDAMNGPIPVDSTKATLYGHDMSGYTYFDRSGLPNYWAYADRFVLADHFFTSMFGPTLPEHLYTVAAQSNMIVDNKSTTDHEGSYCDDHTESATRFTRGGRHFVGVLRRGRRLAERPADDPTRALRTDVERCPIARGVRGRREARGDASSVVGDPTRVLQRSPGCRQERLRGRELDREPRELDHEERVLALDGDRRGVG
jgi:hypothetical protein